MKQIGLMTCYLNNFGACLQAYALQQTIRDFGMGCEIIRYTPARALKVYPFVFQLLLSVRNRLKGLAQPNHRYEIARGKRFNQFRNKYLDFGQRAYNHMDDLYREPPNYDVFVCGSDQIWNPIIHGNTNNRAYFLDFVPKGKKRVAYAPSIGITKLPDSCEVEMATLLKQFDVLSTRELAGSELVEKLTDRPCRTVLDPTLLLERGRWEEMAKTPLFDGPYLFCYLFGTASYIERFIHQVAQRTGLPVVTIPFTDREYESDFIKMKQAGPLEFVSLIRHAALVITDSFHATAFSINLHVPFYSLLRNTAGEYNNMNSRILSILKITGLEERLIAGEEDFPEAVNLQLNFHHADEILIERRAADLQFLRDALQNEANDAS